MGDYGLHVTGDNKCEPVGLSHRICRIPRPRVCKERTTKPAAQKNQLESAKLLLRGPYTNDSLGGNGG